MTIYACKKVKYSGQSAGEKPVNKPGMQLCRGCEKLPGQWNELAQQRGDTNGIQRLGRKSAFHSLVSES